MSTNLLCYLAFHLFMSSFVNGLSDVPAIYIFGDSTVDTGNHLPMPIYPYGIDLDVSLPSRWTNGLAISDYIAAMLDLPFAPPFNISELAQKSTTGVNYAFGGAGILPETKLEEVVGNWTFDKQISYFNSTITNLLNKTFSEPDQLFYYLTKSIFLISFGINDYLVNFSSFKNQSTMQPITFAIDLLAALSERLNTLYRMGARKFFVNNIWPMGCMPTYHLDNLEICNEIINEKILPYANSLPNMLHGLASTLPGFDFSYSDNFSFARELNLTTQETGITNTTGKCWDRDVDVCKDRDIFVYFDIVHTTQVVNRMFARGCFGGTLCFPKSISDLVRN